MLLVPGDTPLVDVAKLAIPVPAACSPGDNRALTCAIRKTLEDNQDVMPAGEQGMTMMSGVSVRSMITQIICPANSIQEPSCLVLHAWVQVHDLTVVTIDCHLAPQLLPTDSPPLLTPPHEDTPLAYIQKGLENHFTKEVALPLSRQVPLVATPPVLVNERMGPGATGVVFAGHIHSFPVIIKTIPPEFGGEADLRHERHVYSLLASLQGRVIPQMYGLFEGEGWTALMIEHCGDKVSDIHQLSLQQREILWQHAHEIHANGIRHTDLELRNLIVSTSGDLRIVDFAYSEVGHECEGGMCRELSYFRTLLKLP
ncbi:hypothetical protein BDZ89DRAFT_1151812 [Hymenopellis radicata]|nr:hypothetical protein BDZ89DRAFT_1151812 [Hymenopellis radicata]